jgi:hypothetical protein
MREVREERERSSGERLGQSAMETEVMIDVATATVEELELAYRRGLLLLRDIPEHKVWYDMKNRCSNPNSARWRYYGGRGIRVCDEWAESFWSFLASVGRRPTLPGFVISIDRIDNDGNYEPSNVKWSSASEQMHNARGRKGAGNNKAILTWPQVRDIRRLRGTASPKALAKVFRVSVSNIRHILDGDSWIDKTYQPGDRQPFVKHMQPSSATGEQSHA